MPADRRTLYFHLRHIAGTQGHMQHAALSRDDIISDKCQITRKDIRELVPQRTAQRHLRS